MKRYTLQLIFEDIPVVSTNTDTAVKRLSDAFMTPSIKGKWVAAEEIERLEKDAESLRAISRDLQEDFRRERERGDEWEKAAVACAEDRRRLESNRDFWHESCQQAWAERDTASTFLKDAEALLAEHDAAWDALWPAINRNVAIGDRQVWLAVVSSAVAKLRPGAEDTP